MGFFEVGMSVMNLLALLMENWMIYRKWFRFDGIISMMIVTAAYIVEEGIFYIPGLGNGVLVLVHYTFFFINLIPIKLEKVDRVRVLQMLYLFLYNVIGTIAMVVCTTFYGVLSGSDNETWMAPGASTSMDYIIHYISILPVGYIAAYLARKGSPLVEKLTRNERIFLILGTVVPNYAFYGFRRLTTEDASDYYGGIIVIFYGIFMISLGLCLVIFIEMALIRIASEQKEIQMLMNQQNEQYEIICELQDGVRELRHDIINHMAAGSISAECISDIVENYQKVYLIEEEVK